MVFQTATKLCLPGFWGVLHYTFFLSVSSRCATQIEALDLQQPVANLRGRPALVLVRTTRF